MFTNQFYSRWGCLSPAHFPTTMAATDPLRRSAGRALTQRVAERPFTPQQSILLLFLVSPLQQIAHLKHIQQLRTDPLLHKRPGWSRTHHLHVPVGDGQQQLLHL